MGVPFLAARVASRDLLESLQPNQIEIEEASMEVEAAGLYLYAIGDQASMLFTRMFAPRLGIPEESATGMGASALSAYLTLSRGRIGQPSAHQGPTVSTYEVIQGEGFVPVPGRISSLVTVDGRGDLLSVELRGECRQVVAGSEK
jgi:predicted PhzF superfamily epimerase YddE/YHI9